MIERERGEFEGLREEERTREEKRKALEIDGKKLECKRGKIDHRREKEKE